MDLNGSGAEYNDGNGALQGVSSSLLTLGSLNAVNQNSANMIAYCWHSVAGYSSIGSYSGNGSTSGPTVTTGFRPAFVMFKNADGADDWVILDSTRNPSNPVNSVLFPSGSYAEETNANRQIEISNTGFQVTSSGQWINGSGQTIIYMAFADTREAAFWKDVSGNNNNWTPNNLDYRDSLIDSPANNFCTMSPLMYRAGNPYVVLSEGNLRVTQPNSAVGFSNFAVDSGKWYWEVFIENNGTANTWDYRGVIEPTAGQTSGLGGTPHFIYSSYNSYYRIDSGSFTLTDTGTANNPDVIGFAWDADNGYMTVSVNGVAGTTITGLTVGTPMCPFVACDYNTIDIMNFGQDSTFSGARPAGGNQDDNGIGDFAYPVPSGYLALCTANLPTPTIVDGSEHFNTVLFSANNSTQSITGVGFQPDWVWTKSRTNAYSHGLYDSVRGVNLRLRSDTTGAEVSQTNMLNSFDADGFSLGQNDDANYLGSGVAWNWKAGGTAVSNTDGSITSQVSANTDAGFSIVSYTGTGANATVGHSLGVQPSMIIAKRRDTAENWPVYTAFTGSSQYAYLDHTQAFGAATSVWQGVDPTSSVFSIGTSLTVNSSGGTYIAYCFANSDTTKVGRYTGNGSTDGPFVYTGFRPAWILIKYSNGSQDWTLFDSKREGFNETDKYLHPSASAAEGDYDTLEVDLLSNGFKCRGPYNHINASGGTYIFLAFAETPFKYANAR
jgi:hypothetical protein